MEAHGTYQASVAAVHPGTITKRGNSRYVKIPADWPTNQAMTLLLHDAKETSK